MVCIPLPLIVVDNIMISIWVRLANMNLVAGLSANMADFRHLSLKLLAYPPLGRGNVFKSPKIIRCTKYTCTETIVFTFETPYAISLRRRAGGVPEAPRC